MSLPLLKWFGEKMRKKMSETMKELKRKKMGKHWWMGGCSATRYLLDLKIFV